MTFEEDTNNWVKISDFFFALEIQTERDYDNGKITKQERNKIQKQIKKDWDYSMIINNPFIKNNSNLKEVAKCFFRKIK